MLVGTSQLTHSTAPHLDTDSSPASNYNVTRAGQVQYLCLMSYRLCNSVQASAAVTVRALAVARAMWG